jgi:hypothetical protein
MPLTDRASELRRAALDASLRLHDQIEGEFALQPGVSSADTVLHAEAEIRDTAEVLYAWLNGTTRLLLTRSNVTRQNSGIPAGESSTEGTPMQLHDDEKFTLSVRTVDAKGFDTADDIDWTADDTSVVTLNVSDDGRSCEVVAGQPGSAVITVTDSATDPVLSATEAVDVVAGGTATIQLTEGDVTKQS